MSIEKHSKNTLRHEDIPYTLMANPVINSIKNTSALGVYCYLATKAAGWEICKKHLQNHFNCGREHINTCFKYLKSVGALEIIMIRDSKGRATGWDTILKRSTKAEHEIIQNTGNPVSGKSSRIRVFQNVGKPESGKSAPIKERNIEKKDYKKINKGTSCEAPDFDYNAHPQKQTPKEARSVKSDNFTDLTVLPVIDHENHPQVADLTEIKIKSDYFDNQILKETQCKNKAHDELEYILERNQFALSEELISDWVANRKKKRLPVTKTSWNQVIKKLNELKEMGINPLDAFETMVASGWQSLKVEYFVSKEQISKHELAKKRSLELEERARTQKQKEIEDSKNFKTIVSQVGVIERNKLRSMLGMSLRS